MQWLNNFRRDLQTYRQLNGGGAWKQVLTERGLWALLVYRVESAMYRSRLPAVLRKPLRWALVPLHIPHAGNIVVHAHAVIGAHCCLCQGVTIGISGRGEHRGVPKLGDRVFVGVNAVVVGKIVVGDDAVIGANSLVNRDVPSHTTALGVPAVVVNQHGSKEYIAPAPRSSFDSVRRLLVVARVNHYRHAGRLYAYTPYAREIDVWAELFPEVMIAGTLRDEAPPADCSAFARQNVTVLPVTDVDRSRVVQAARLPKTIWQLLRYMRCADAIHVRCPCDLGLLGVLFAPLFTRRLYAKYATNWPGFPGEPWAWRLQRAVLRSRWWHGPVTVYGDWPAQNGNVVPFFTSVLTAEQIARARAHVAASKPSSDALRVLFVGRLSKSKNADILLSAVAALKRNVECTIVGEGSEQPALAAHATQLGLNGEVRFTGGASLEQVLGWYERSDVLVLVSDLEGWPKAISEAMTFGLVCIGADRGIVPWMLAEGRGIVVQPRNVVALATALRQVAADREQSRLMGRRAADWAQQHSLEGLRDALRELLKERWQ
jgi:glycosyltransferase involved in cell wall biosynthesis